jgi:hypothetical protein
LKGEVPDVKKVKPSLQAIMPSEGFCILRNKVVAAFGAKYNGVDKDNIV